MSMFTRALCVAGHTANTIAAIARSLPILFCGAGGLAAQSSGPDTHADAAVGSHSYVTQETAIHCFLDVPSGATDLAWSAVMLYDVHILDIKGPDAVLEVVISSVRGAAIADFLGQADNISADIPFDSELLANKEGGAAGSPDTPQESAEILGRSIAGLAGSVFKVRLNCSNESCIIDGSEAAMARIPTELRESELLSYAICKDILESGVAGAAWQVPAVRMVAGHRWGDSLSTHSCVVGGSPMSWTETSARITAAVGGSECTVLSTGTIAGNKGQGRLRVSAGESQSTFTFAAPGRQILRGVSMRNFTIQRKSALNVWEDAGHVSRTDAWRRVSSGKMEAKPVHLMTRLSAVITASRAARLRKDRQGISLTFRGIVRHLLPPDNTACMQDPGEGARLDMDDALWEREMALRVHEDYLARAGLLLGR